MAERKQAMNLTVPQDLADAFYAVCDEYGHGKQKGMILSAAIWMFLEADPADQGRCIKAVASAEIDEGVQRMIAKLKGGDPRRPRMAAKAAGRSVHALEELPKPGKPRRTRKKKKG